MSATANKRLGYIDATKGVAILCIAFLHFEKGVIPEWLNVWIGLFMISTFYFTSGWISGITNRQTKPNELLKKRIRQLGIPYLWFSLLIILFDILWVALGFMESGVLLRDVYKTIVLRGIGTLWFLPVLVIGEYLFAIVRYSRKVWFWGTLFMAMTLAANYAYNNLWLPIRGTSELNKIIDAPMQPIVRGLYAWPIVAIGYMIAKQWGRNILNAGKLLLFLTSSALLAISILLVTAPPFEIYHINRVLSNILPAIAFMGFFAMLPKNLITGFFTYWGVNSLVLMCTHLSITMEILMAFDRHVLHHPAFEGPITILYFAVCILLTYPLAGLFNGKLKFMTGK